MAGTVRPATFQPYGDEGPTIFLSTDGNPPSHIGDGTFKVGDRVINTVPTAGGIAEWIVTTGGNGATATFTALSFNGSGSSGSSGSSGNSGSSGSSGAAGSSGTSGVDGSSGTSGSSGSSGTSG